MGREGRTSSLGGLTPTTRARLLCGGRRRRRVEEEQAAPSCPTHVSHAYISPRCWFDFRVARCSRGRVGLSLGAYAM